MIADPVDAFVEYMKRLVAQDKRQLRNDAIEECAREASHWGGDVGEVIADKIRALKQRDK